MASCANNNVTFHCSNRVLTLLKNGKRTRFHFLRECLQLSQDEMVWQMWHALETYDHMAEKDKEECLQLIRQYTRAQSNPRAPFDQLIEGTLGNVPEKGIKGALRGAVIDFLAEKSYAASVLGRVADGLFESLEASAVVREVFDLQG